MVPALGGAVISLLTGGALFSSLEETAAPAPRIAGRAPAPSGLRGSVLADIGPHAPQSFAPRSARVPSDRLFVARAAPASSAPEQIAAAPEPPERPDALRMETDVAMATPAADPGSVDAPTPPRRPADLAAAPKAEAQRTEPVAAAPEAPRTPPRQMARAGSTSVPAAPADGRGFFERLFGGAPQAAAPQVAGRPGREVMAYAASPDTGGLFGGLRSAVAPVNPAARYDRYTAIYDISARTVYMPDGSRLEAHSGLREHLDDPRYVHLRMRGATPPHIYNLTPREALFHGVEALRLNPVGGGGAIFGRAGLLAHTYMLGPNGDSNGCVSFRDYNAFLQAYKRGEIRRLAVVAHL